MRVEDELGTGEIERVERLVEGRPGGIEHGADGAIGEDRSSGETVEQRMGHGGTPGSLRSRIAQLYPRTPLPILTASTIDIWDGHARVAGG